MPKDVSRVRGSLSRRSGSSSGKIFRAAVLIRTSYPNGIAAGLAHSSGVTQRRSATGFVVAAHSRGRQPQSCPTAGFCLCEIWLGWLGGPDHASWWRRAWGSGRGTRAKRRR